MAIDSEPDVRLEIGHVLFIDVVAYSKLLITEQRERLQTLNEIVRNTVQFRASDANRMLVRIPTGDGMALIFRDTVEAPLRCAVEISQAIKTHPEIQLRMGIHGGPVSEVTDVNERTNIAGAGIDVAQRVMDCGDAGHILLSKHVADDLAPHPRWSRYLQDLGECQVKHGVRVGVVNFYGDEIGNPKVPKQLQVLKKHRTRMRWSAISVALLLFIGVVAAFVILSKKSAKSITTVPPEKSIAVLPFENLSGNPENAYFTEGIQEEILTRLAKIADLKVISRTSTQHFKSSPDNLPQIAQQLGVANILEGSVQRVAGQVHVNVQLIKASTDAHLWAEAYDRKLTDIFAAEADIATTIAETLQAKLTGVEKNAIAKPPTANPEAYELYLKGLFFWNKRTGADLRTPIEYFNQALGKDPSYALAYVGLADSYSLLNFYGGTASPADSFPQAKAAAKKALAFDDTSAEAHTSFAFVLESYDFDLEQSVKEFERAIQLNPNYATAHHWIANGVLPALGQFDRSIAEGKRAVELDPLSLIINANLGEDYFYARRYDEAIAQFRKTIEMDPRFYYAQWCLGQVWQLKGQLNEAINQYRKAVELNDDPYVLALLGQAYARRGQRDEAQKILARLNEEAKSRYVHAYSFALMYLGLGDKERAIYEMERAYRERADGDVFLIKVDPMLDDLRGNPRFEALVQKVFAPKKPDADSQ
jgi:TolB-like protein/Tfp pilus assembly protein PilF